MIVQQLINRDITRRAFLLFTRRTKEDEAASRTGWFIKGFGYQSPGSSSFRNFRLQLIK